MKRRMITLCWFLLLSTCSYSQVISPNKVYFFNNGPINQIKTLINQVIYIKMPEKSTVLIESDEDSLGFLVNAEAHYFHFLKGKTSYYTNATGQFMPIAEDLFWLNAHLLGSRKAVRYEIKNKWLKRIDD